MAFQVGDRVLKDDEEGPFRLAGPGETWTHQITEVSFDADLQKWLARATPSWKVLEDA